MNLRALVYSVIAGFVIEAFFQLVKYRDSLNREGPRPVTSYGVISDASNYMTVAQYLSGGNRRWLNYFLFRLLPPTIIFILLSGILLKYFNIQSNLPYLFTAGVVSLALRDGLNLVKASLVSEKLLHLFNIFLVLLLCPIIWILGNTTNLAIIAPSVEGLIDNLWSSLFVALLVLLYLRATNMGAKYQDQAAQDTAISNYVFNAYIKIRDQYGKVIEEACRKYVCSRQILYAILIYENMNRSPFFRKAENWLVRTFRLRLTVGIAQVRSDKPLTDEDSIFRAAKVLSGSIYADSGTGSGFPDIQQLEDVLANYNASKSYAESISIIIAKLRIYVNDLFR